ncbi:hypothetical protein [Pinisolibacter aquiterrae]|uniref:hypothetical protein n=1 Tax=Pinisolibacter aquiterrae TaxID=2815579 RepID=UPI001C3DDB49|nr:hypothetical protein [Pinisolibacter aquiterrae]MBV5262572.1 hypothetical protein [Pinisolibacter aquiterrae]MCC8237024.1 hypothetical protein [Pinisolibacter aquiterrae]
MARATREEASQDRLSPEVLAAANINPNTRLATDYLNHFNDVVMMLELVPDMPDCAEDVVGWTPLAYEDYFRNSHFRERDLAVLAWKAADPAIRSEFEATITHLDCAMAEAIALVDGWDGRDPAGGHRLRAFVGDRLKPLIATASGIINGPPSMHAAPAADSLESEAQAAVDELFP